MEDENMRDMDFPEGFEDVTSKYARKNSGNEGEVRAIRPPTLREFFSADKLKEYAPAIGYFLFSAVMSGVELYPGTYPFGFALLCAAEGPAFFCAALAGVIFGSLFANGGVYITGCALIVALGRCVLSAVEAHSPSLRTKAKGVAPSDAPIGKQISRLSIAELLSFCEGLPVRCALCASAAVVCGGVNLLFLQNIYMAIAGLVLSAAICPLLCAAYSGLFAVKISRAKFSYFILATVYSVSLALGELSILGFSLGSAFALGSALWGAWALNLPEAALCAFCAALPMDSGVTVAIILAALGAGIVKNHSSILASFTALAISLTFSIAAEGLGALSLYGTEFILVCAAVAPLGKFGFLTFPKPKFSFAVGQRSKTIPNPGEDEETPFTKRSRAQLRSLGECFASLSGMASSVGRLLSTPSESEIRERIAAAFDRTCASCGHQSICWEKGYDDLSELRHRLAAAAKEGQRNVEIPPRLRARCLSMDAIIRSVITPRPSPGGDEGNCHIFADDWHAMGELFSDISEKLESDAGFDRAASRRLRTSLALLGVEAQRVAVYGERLRQTELTGIGAASLHIGSEELRRCAENALGVRMSDPQISVEGDGLSVKMKAREKYRVKVGRFLASAKVGACGDSVCAFAGEDGYFRAMISDGMGSGNEAAFTSGTVTLFLERLLSSGVRMKNALSIVNSFLRERKIESSATVDIMELDLLCGGAQFIKSGAAPSFVLREGRLFKLRSRTVPIGILSSADAEMIAFSVKAGDVIVMMSDGVTQTNEDCPWLYDILCSDRLEHLTASAKRIADEAAKKSEDDISVMVMRVEEA